jgi:cbb3-type cytochrome oxidase subunit 1
MEWFVRWFLKASLAWLALGVTAGVAMAVHPVWTVYKAAHVHMVVLGFVTMMIYGVAYHVIPRFAGYPLAHRRMAGVHWWMANAGLLLMVCGLVIRATDATPGTIVLSVGGSLSALAAYTFVVIMWRTIDGTKALRETKQARILSLKKQLRSQLPVASTTEMLHDVGS